MTAVPAGEGRFSLLAAQIPLHQGAPEALEGVRASAKAFMQQHPGTNLQITGGQAIADDFTRYAEADTKRSELTALPLIALILLFVFGALVATGLPLLVGLLSISVTMGLIYPLTGLFDVATFAQSVITMLGLGAGIDYALLMVSRFREELGRGLLAPEAAAASMQTAGRSVIWSGVTVAVAMSGLLLPPIPLIQSIGAGGVLAVLMTVLASLTALPAALTLLGERVNSPRRLSLRPTRLAETSPGWARWARRVLARPWHYALLGTALLVLLALPLRGAQTGYGGRGGSRPE
ncbi:MMPL family transporter [Deinococcus lacus]|uniref:MMPL family transporter n=1 Tax=Deinococcus lacus TaxID=392561 RepID=A0ABW1YEV7_9DEIO